MWGNSSRKKRQPGRRAETHGAIGAIAPPGSESRRRRQPCFEGPPCAPPPHPRLRRLPPPECALADCGHPDHLYRVCNEETPPPPYSRVAMDRLVNREDGAPGSDSRRTDHERPQTQTQQSFSTDGQGRPDPGTTWCQLAYWEMNRRVGKRYDVDQPAVNVYAASHADRGLCLDALARGDSSDGPPSPDGVARTRAKIGPGVILSKEANDVWVYNRSEQPVFVHSPLLDDVETRSFLVYKVPSKHCLRIFDSEKAKRRPTPHRRHYSSAPTGPVDFDSVRISFVKGWGPKYKRQEVSACPCWLEVMLSTRR